MSPHVDVEEASERLASWVDEAPYGVEEFAESVEAAPELALKDVE